MKRVYVAGPYRAPDVLGMLRNIREGIRVAVLLMETGDAPFCPWLDHQYGLQAEIPLETYQKTSMAWLEVSDAVVLVHGWQKSQGTLAEIRRARGLGIPVYDGVEAYHRNETLASIKLPGGPESWLVP